MPDFRDERIWRAIEAAKHPDRERQLRESLAQTRAMLADLWKEQERLDRKIAALRAARKEEG